MAETLFSFTVTHVDGRSVTLPATNPIRAVYDALAQWGGSFKEEANCCKAVKGGTARKPMCRKCGREYGRIGQKKGLCPDCERIEALIRRDMAQRSWPDRRPGYGR